MELSIFQKLAVMQAIYKSVADEVSTKNPDGVRGQADAYMAERYAESGEKVTKRIHINGYDVGTLSTKESKPVPQKVTVELEVVDMDKLAVWMTDGLEQMVDEFYRTIEDELIQRFALWYLEQTGEVPDGCELVTNIEPERPRAYAGTVLKINEKEVARAMGGALPAYLGNLLEGGIEE